MKRDETLLGRYPLRYADTSSDFAGTLPVELPGRYDVTAYAYDPASGNTGVDHLTHRHGGMKPLRSGGAGFRVGAIPGL